MRWPIYLICAVAVGYTGLHLSASWGHLETLKALVEAGANPALKNCHEECAYDIAQRYGRTQCAEYLEAAGGVYQHGSLGIHVERFVWLRKRPLRHVDFYCYTLFTLSSLLYVSPDSVGEWYTELR